MRSTCPWRRSQGSPPSAREPHPATLDALLFNPHTLQFLPCAAAGQEPGSQIQTKPPQLDRERGRRTEEKETPTPIQEEEAPLFVPRRGTAGADAARVSRRRPPAREELRRHRRRQGGVAAVRAQGARTPPESSCRRVPTPRPSPLLPLHRVGNDYSSSSQSRADDMQARSKQQPQQAAEIQMSMLSSYTTLVGLAPPLPGKLFSRSAAQPPAAATVSLPGVPAIISRPQQQSSRAPRFRCSAYNIRHNALVELKRIHPETDGDKWTISEDKDYITLKFNVGKETKKDMLDVTTAEYQEMLIIKGKPDSDIGKELNAHLQMPPGCAAEKVTAKLSDGWLEVKIAKPTNEKTSIPIDQN